MKKAVFSFLLCLCFFVSVFQAYGQEKYNVHALEDFKHSLESLVKGDYDNAILYSSYVLRRDPDSSVAYTVRARAYFEKGDMANAIADCTQAINRDKNNVSAYLIRANAHAKNGSVNRAVSDWKAVLRINPENADAINNIELATNAQ
ncbi:MAG: tetratricopeptide repeat protein [Treponema sp.]|jgi:Tfp pilus assembly protein PilF|nr:tetratricopeptide repeat protein [Treponema sp.]